MTRIGFLQHRTQPHHQAKIYQYAATAQMEGADLYVFHPRDVLLNQNEVNGWNYRNGHWKQSRQPMPEVIINGSPLVNLLASEGYERFQNLTQNIPFTCHSVGTKDTVHALLDSKRWSRTYLPAQLKVDDYETFATFVEQHEQIMLKPQRGNNGNGIRKLFQNGSAWLIQDGNDKEMITVTEKSSWFDAELIAHPTLAQQYIHSITPLGEAFDLRIHVQKNKRLEWTVSAVHPKIAPPNTVVTNDLQGGSVALIDPFMKRVFGDEATQVLRKAKQLTLQIAHVLDEHRQSLGEYPLSQLGFDIGISSDGHPWIYEVNWYPGYPAMLNWYVEIARNHIQYAMAIAELNRKGKWPPILKKKWLTFQ